MRYNPTMFHVKAKIAIFSIFLGFIPFLANATEDFSNPVLPFSYGGTTYTDYIKGCANGAISNPCGTWVFIFFNDDSIYSNDTEQYGDLANTPVGSDVLYTTYGSTEYGKIIGFQSGVAIGYPCNSIYTECNFPLAGGSLAITNGTVQNQQVFSHVISTRDIYSTSTGQITDGNNTDTRIISITSPLDESVQTTNVTFSGTYYYNDNYADVATSTWTPWVYILATPRGQNATST